MNDKWTKCIGWAFNNHFATFHKANDIHSSISMVINLFGKPVPAGFDEFKLMQTGPFFNPSLTFSDFFNTVNQILPGPFSGSIPLNIVLPISAYIRISGFCQTKAAPVPTINAIPSSTEPIASDAFLIFSGSKKASRVSRVRYGDPSTNKCG